MKCYFSGIPIRQLRATHFHSFTPSVCRLSSQYPFNVYVILLPCACAHMPLYVGVFAPTPTMLTVNLESYLIDKLERANRGVSTGLIFYVYFVCLWRAMCIPQCYVQASNFVFALLETGLVVQVDVSGYSTATLYPVVVPEQRI